MNITKLRGWGFYRSGRRAVGSRSRWGLHNMRAISRYFPHEIYMTADERKDTILPCGYTIAQSWAALRKSWLGFNISHCNGDWSGMSKYAWLLKFIIMYVTLQDIYEWSIVCQCHKPLGTFDVNHKLACLKRLDYQKPLLQNVSYRIRIFIRCLKYSYRYL